jgi:ubiquinone biosynthesis protein
MSRTTQVLFGFARFFVPFLVEEGGRLLPGLRILRRSESTRQNPERLRRFVLEMGGAFVKFGQFFSMRSDILPPAYCQALSDMFDQVPPFPAEEARRIVACELGHPVEEIFESFDDEAVGAASFGQAHIVTLWPQDAEGGTRRAVVKVVRPGAEERMQEDIRLLLFLGWLVDVSSVLGKIKLLPIFRDFVRWIRRETALVQEARNADHLHEVTSWNLRQRIPFVYWKYTTNRVATMEYLDGLPVTRAIERLEAGDTALDDELSDMGCDRKVLARNLFQSFVLQSFVGHVFHGDPHPGNLIILPDNIIGFVDFGLLGRLNEEARREQSLMMDAVIQENVERLFLAVLDVLDAPRGLSVTDVYDDFYEEADEWLDACDNPGVKMAEKSLSRFITSATQIARRTGLVLPSQTMLYFKALLTVDSVVLRLNPEFDYKKESRRAVRLVRMRELEKLYSPGALIDQSLSIQLLASSAPEFLVSRLQDFEQGRKTIFRKLNLIPITIAWTFRSAALVVGLAGAGLLSLRLGIADSIPFMKLSLVQMLLDTVSPVLWGVPVIFVALLWCARFAASRAYVKVNRKE